MAKVNPKINPNTQLNCPYKRTMTTKQKGHAVINQAQNKLIASTNLSTLKLNFNSAEYIWQNI